jgi:hypothetical protein
VQVVAYAGDVDLITSNTIRMEVSFSNLENEALRVKLKVNKAKTKYIRTGNALGNTQSMRTLALNNGEVEQVNEFVYLGSQITSN